MASAGAATCLQRVAQALRQLDDSPVEHGMQLVWPHHAWRPLLLLWQSQGHQCLQALQEGRRCLQRFQQFQSKQRCSPQSC